MSQKILLSDDGTVIDPQLHDALICGLFLSKKNLLILLKTIVKEDFFLVLHGVDRLKVDDFREGNTILDVTVSSFLNLEITDVANAYDIEPHDVSFLPKILDRLKENKFITVRINPSYGCSLVCVCQSIHIQNDISIY